LGAVLKRSGTSPELDAVRDHIRCPHTGFRVWLRSDEELNNGLDRQSAELCGDFEALLRARYVSQISASQPFQQEHLAQHSVDDLGVHLGSKPTFSSSGNLDVMEDGQRKPPLPAHAAHDKACSRILVGERARIACKTKGLYEIDALGVWLEPIEVK
jgi:hypothetical protein